ncbi:hypothetical protein LQ757_07125 [Agromyces sp. SYSU K20354]|uniref:Rv1678 family membrane protein n=1 Tax=Agromyces cavernae TaxID=2898659 RepID=UPI001E515A54|nr:hypothetical protein [Agromyces cavernae]MCD2442049.1 hypothetical protein [Agromyces cavernae]
MNGEALVYEERARYDRAAIALGTGSLVASVFVFGAAAPTPIDFAHVGLGGAIVLAVLGVVGILGGALHRGILTLIAGGGLTIAALVQLATLQLSPRLLGGDASLMSLLGAFGIGLLAVGVARRSAASTPSGTTSTLDRRGGP